MNKEFRRKLPPRVYFPGSEEVPIGLLHALCENKSAMKHYVALTEEEKSKLLIRLRRSRSIFNNF